MKVKVSNGVAGVLADVEHQAVAGGVDSLSPGDFVGRIEHVSQHRAVAGAQFGGIGDVASGNDQDMGRSDRGQVPEGDDVLSVDQLVGGDAPVGDAAENAVGHRRNLPARGDTARFLADARTEESSRSRARRHWLRQQAVEGATFGGVLRSLAETGREARLLVDGWELVGSVGRAGATIIAVETASGPAWIATRALLEVTVIGREGAASDDRPLEEGPSWSPLLAGLQEERHQIEVRSGGRWIDGRISGVGVDVVTLATPGGTTYLPLERIAAVRLTQTWGSG